MDITNKTTVIQEKFYALNFRKMRKNILFVFLLLVVTVADAQHNDSKGFDKSNLFTGGNVTLAFGYSYTDLGLSPHFGYSINKWLDVAANANLNYVSQRDNYQPGDKIRQTTYGPGAFVRIFPINFLYAQIQYEHNFTSQKYIPVSGSTEKIQLDANSLLLGIGYTSGRSSEENTYYYFSVMFDVLGVRGSPYLDYLQRSLPIVKAGFNIALFQGNYHRHRR
jgi:hypothetical protein